MERRRENLIRTRARTYTYIHAKRRAETRSFPRTHARARPSHHDRELWFPSIPWDPRLCAADPHTDGARRAPPFLGVGVYMECNTVAGSVTWLFRGVPGWPWETREGGLGRLLRARARGAPAGRGKEETLEAMRSLFLFFPHVVFHRIFLSHSLFLFLSPPTLPCPPTSRVPLLPAPYRYLPLFLCSRGTTAIFCGNPQMWLGRIRPFQPRPAPRPGSTCCCELAKSQTIDADADAALLRGGWANKEK